MNDDYGGGLYCHQITPSSFDTLKIQMPFMQWRSKGAGTGGRVHAPVKNKLENREGNGEKRER